VRIGFLIYICVIKQSKKLETMTTQKLSKETNQILQDLQDDINRMMRMESNMEVVWELEKLQNNKVFQKSADFIRKSLK
jgi:hypothetical protein